MAGRRGSNGGKRPCFAVTLEFQSSALDVRASEFVPTMFDIALTERYRNIFPANDSVLAGFAVVDVGHGRNQREQTILTGIAAAKRIRRSDHNLLGGKKPYDCTTSIGVHLPEHAADRQDKGDQRDDLGLAADLKTEHVPHRLRVDHCRRDCARLVRDFDGIGNRYLGGGGGGIGAGGIATGGGIRMGAITSSEASGPVFVIGFGGYGIRGGGAIG